MNSKTSVKSITSRLLALNGLAALALPFHHAAGYGLMVMQRRAVWQGVPLETGYDPFGGLPFYLLISGRQLLGFAIPTFLFVSGFFVAFLGRQTEPSLSWEKVIPRIKFLLPPFFIWTAAHWLLLGRLPSSIVNVLEPYYYIPLLCQLYLLSPIILRFAKTHCKLLLLIAAALQLGPWSLKYIGLFQVEVPGLVQLRSITPIWLFTEGVLSFTIGVIAGTHLQQFKDWLQKHRRLLLISLVGLAILTAVEYHAVVAFMDKDWLGPRYSGISRNLYQLVFVVSALSVGGNRIPFAKRLSWVGTKSLGIYLLNSPTIYVVGSILFHKVPWVLNSQLLYQSILIGTGLLIPLLVLTIVTRTPARRFYRLMFG